MRTAALTFAIGLTLIVSERGIAQSSADALLGSWERIAQTNRSGKPFLSEMRAVLILNQDGYYSHTAVRPRRAKTTRPLAQLTLKEMLERFEGAEARYGKFTISGDTIMRNILGSLDPANTSTALQAQLFQITGDTLVLKSPSASDKTEVRFRRLR